MKVLIVYPFSFLWFKIFVPLEIFSLIWSYRWRAAKFDLYSELMDINQWRFWACHTYCDTGHRFIFSSPRDTHNSYQALSIGAVITCFTTCIFRGWDSKNPTSRMRVHRFNRLRHHDQITYRKTQFEKLKLIQIHAITRFFFPYLAFLRISSVLKTSVPKFLCTDVFLYW